MTESVRLQSSGMRTLGAATVGLAALIALGLVVSGDWSGLLRYAGPLGLLALLGLATLWMPYVDVSDAGVELRNVLRTVRVPWPAIHDVEGRYGLRLRTAYGTVTSWAAQAPAGRERLHGGDSVAAAEVRRRLDRLRDQGHLENPRLESEALPASWHTGILAATGVLVAVTVVVWSLA